MLEDRHDRRLLQVHQISRQSFPHCDPLHISEHLRGDSVECGNVLHLLLPRLLRIHEMVGEIFFDGGNLCVELFQRRLVMRRQCDPRAFHLGDRIAHNLLLLPSPRRKRFPVTQCEKGAIHPLVHTQIGRIVGEADRPLFDDLSEHIRLEHIAHMHGRTPEFLQSILHLLLFPHHGGKGRVRKPSDVVRSRSSFKKEDIKLREQLLRRKGLPIRKSEECDAAVRLGDRLGVPFHL